jgi:hypothetical protein
MAVSLALRSSSYPAVFRVGFQDQANGTLVVDEEALLLEGRSPQGRIELRIPYSELDEVRIGRLPEERLNGRASLLLSYRDGQHVRVEPIGFGLLHELAELLAEVAREHRDEHERVAVVLPLRKSRIAEARELVEDGPPFDPAVLGLKGHEVYLSEDEAVFVFEGPNVRTMLQRLTRDPTLWQAGIAWRSCVCGRPHLLPEAHLPNEPPVYSWKAEGE